ncbi:hypothetical protein QBC47DRAFT_440335 [Echria macrotheca]|uniref:Uncharacterized protein n=1 Tax=Echria macrotheca TaxID=438768 RepID=A0AAJ0F8H7_9PEZI|nr:hypothetical protein QBC47DRAFT_440335 [Echria macrotheca]
MLKGPATAEACSLTALPAELIHQIVQHISYPLLDPVLTPNSSNPPPSLSARNAAQALHSLSNLSLTSKLLYDVTTPLLYREFALGYTDPKGIHFRPSVGQRTVSFTRTLLTRRDLAALVKHAFLHPKLIELMGAENREIVSSLAKRTLNHDVFDGEDIEVLVFALMPNLERLVFASCSYVPMSLPVRRAAWKNLKSLELVAEYDWSYSQLQVIKRYEEDILSGWVGTLPDEDDDL